MLDFLLRALAGERIDLPPTFFDAWLEGGHAVVLLDGMDEVADPDLRRRTARLIEQFVQAYPDCRYVVTSRKVGYAGASRLGEGFVTTTVRDFTLADIEQFLTNWHRMLAAGLALGDGEAGTHYADNQTAQLLSAIRDNDRIRDLAINPLMTVIAMVHRTGQAARPPPNSTPKRSTCCWANGTKHAAWRRSRSWTTGPSTRATSGCCSRPLPCTCTSMNAKRSSWTSLHLLHQMFFDMTPDMRARNRPRRAAAWFRSCGLLSGAARASSPSAT
ncbi:MAG: hypothetical protein R2854_18915 [Caldilineaceae bacterium]